ncbi:MAG: pectate lyase, partial [Armatimonadota bacterium]
MLQKRTRSLCLLTMVPVMAVVSGPGLAQQDLPAQALAAMKKATAFFTTEIACHGGYLGRYSEDMTDVWGEGRAQIWQNWIQPPGCPTVGLAYVRAYEATGDKQFLDAAVGCAHALAWGQLESGGWYYIVDFSPRGEQRYFYRHNARAPDASLRSGRNLSTLDDNTTQHALRLLMAVDQLVADPEVHHTTMYGLDGLIKAQHEDGAWPQQFNAEPPEEMPTAEYTRIDEQGRKTVHQRPASYRHYATFNDGAMNDTLEIMLEACRRYGAAQYLESARRCGDYMIKSQIAPPQSGWAQQYTPDGKPEWARRFEPPAVCAAVTARNIRSLCELYLVTADEKYLKPIPPAIDWLNRSRLPNGQHARFYELGTNKPLYFTKDTYHLTYSPDN